MGRAIEPRSLVRCWRKQRDVHFCVTEAPLLSNRRTWFLARALSPRHSVLQWRPPTTQKHGLDVSHSEAGKQNCPSLPLHLSNIHQRIPNTANGIPLFLLLSHCSSFTICTFDHHHSRYGRGGSRLPHQRPWPLSDDHCWTTPTSWRVRPFQYGDSPSCTGAVQIADMCPTEA